MDKEFNVSKQVFWDCIDLCESNLRYNVNVSVRWHTSRKLSDVESQTSRRIKNFVFLYIQSVICPTVVILTYSLQ